MDLASFIERYPHFAGNASVSTAIGDATILINSYTIDEGKRDLALAYLTAHLLTLEPSNGVTEPQVTKVKADTVEVQFSDKQTDRDWLDLTSYGRLFALLAMPKDNAKPKSYGIIKDCDKGAITFDRRDLYDGHVCTKGEW